MKEALQKMGALLPMNIFLRQEVDRMQKVIAVVNSTLCNLKLAIDGTIVMSSSLKEALDAMYDARIPQAWRKVIFLHILSSRSVKSQFFSAPRIEKVYSFSLIIIKNSGTAELC